MVDHAGQAHAHPLERLGGDAVFRRGLEQQGGAAVEMRRAVRFFGDDLLFNEQLSVFVDEPAIVLLPPMSIAPIYIYNPPNAACSSEMRKKTRRINMAAAPIAAESPAERGDAQIDRAAPRAASDRLARRSMHRSG